MLHFDTDAASVDDFASASASAFVTSAFVAVAGADSDVDDEILLCGFGKGNNVYVLLSNISRIQFKTI